MMYLEEISLIFSLGFMQRAFIAGALIALISPILGHFLISKNGSGFADGISHVAILGIGLSSIATAGFQWPAFIVTTIAAIGIEWLNKNRKTPTDAAIVLMVVTSLAAVSILSSLGYITQSFESLFFGSITTISLSEVYWFLGLGSLVIGWIIWNYQALIKTTILGPAARLVGVNHNYTTYGIMVCAAIVITFAASLIGGLLASGLMVIPVITAIRFGRGFKTTQIIASILAVICTFFGILFAWFLDIPPGASISALLIMIYIVVLLISGDN